MEFVENEVEPDQVGGMENLKNWMEKREKAFGVGWLLRGDAISPSGVLIMGISGCGKSLFVKAIAARWRLPLVRLDMATVYEGTFGIAGELACARPARPPRPSPPACCGSTRWRRASPPRGSRPKGGPASRVLGYFLTWMQEKRQPVFVAATANAIEMLPAEILRKGRFDEIFYVALPEPCRAGGDFPHPPAEKEFDPEAFQTRHAGPLRQGLLRRRDRAGRGQRLLRSPGSEPGNDPAGHHGERSAAPCRFR